MYAALRDHDPVHHVIPDNPEHDFYARKFIVERIELLRAAGSGDVIDTHPLAVVGTRHGC